MIEHLELDTSRIDYLTAASELACPLSLAGAEHLNKYRPVAAIASGFCTHCGIIPYGFVEAAEWNAGAYVSVNVACLDDLEPAELLAAPIRHLDGRADTWAQIPETRHL
jgi:hypothetical protein